MPLGGGLRATWKSRRQAERPDLVATTSAAQAIRAGTPAKPTQYHSGLHMPSFLHRWTLQRQTLPHLRGWSGLSTAGTSATCSLAGDRAPDRCPRDHLMGPARMDTCSGRLGGERFATLSLKGQPGLLDVSDDAPASRADETIPMTNRCG